MLGLEGGSGVQQFSLLFTALGTFPDGPFTPFIFPDKYQNDDQVPANYPFDSPLRSLFFFPLAINSMPE